MNEGSYGVLEKLPSNGQKCLCFGYKTYCCKEDMETERAWHEVTFRLEVSSYKLKSQIPLDVEESILEKHTVGEIWDMGPEFMDGHVLGVVAWKPIQQEE